MYTSTQQRRLDRLARRYREGRGDADRVYGQVRDIVSRTPGKYSYQLHLCAVGTQGRTYEHVEDVRSVMDEAIWRALGCWDPARGPFWAYVDMRVEMAARKYWWSRGQADDMPVHVSGQKWGDYLRAVLARDAGRDYDEDLVRDIEFVRFGVSLDAERGDEGDGTCLMDLLRSRDEFDALILLLQEIWHETPGLTDDDEDLLMWMLGDLGYDEVALARGRGESGDDLRERWLVILGMLAEAIEARRAGDDAGEAS